MKIIANLDGGFICEVTHNELEKFFDTYYAKKIPYVDRKVSELRIGNTLDLGRGHDWYSDIKQALQTTREFVTTNRKIIQAICNGLHVESTDVEILEQIEESK
jgi:proline dehydrogenase